MSDAVLIAILSGTGSTLAVQLVLWLRNRRKDDAEADKTVGETWQTIVGELKGQIEDLRTRVGNLEGERETLLERVKGLIAEVDHYRRIARAMARHVLKLRDELAKTASDVPPLPSEVEDALTVIDMPGPA